MRTLTTAVILMLAADISGCSKPAVAEKTVTESFLKDCMTMSKELGVAVSQAECETFIAKFNAGQPERDVIDKKHFWRCGVWATMN